MPNQAEAVAGVRFEVQDESAIEKARHILEELCFKEEILQGTRRPKQHSSMLAYATHAQKIKRNRSNLGKLNRKGNKGNPIHPIMQFDNRLALSGGTPASNHLPTEHLKESQFALTRSHYSKPDKKFQDRLPVTENITWVPATTLNHYSVTCTSCIQCQEEQQQQNRVKRIAILKSNDETVYANYNVSDSGTTGGQQTAFGETAAETESLLEQDATGDSLIHENRNDVNQVGAYIKLNEPDEFHPGILPRPGNGGIGKLTPRFTLDVTLPRMEADEHVCLSPCSEQDEEYHEDDIVNGENLQQTGMGGITKQDTSDSKQDLSDDAKPEQPHYPTSRDKHVTVAECPQQNARSGNTSVDKEEPTSATKDTGVSDPNNSLSTRDKYVLHDQAQLKSGSGSVTFQPDGTPQKRMYSMRKSLALRMAKPNTSSSKFLEKYAKYNAQLQVAEDKIETFSGSFSDIKRDPNTPPSSPQENDLSSSGLTLRSILKPSGLDPSNIVVHEDAARITPNIATSTHLKVKPEAQFRVRKVPQGKQAANKQVGVKKAKDGRTKSKKDDSTSGHKDRKPVQVDFVDNLTPESYHKAYTVNNKPLPTHMKRILENAMESVPKSSGKDSSKNVSQKEQRNVNVNQACEILDDIVDFHTKRRDNGKVCRHGMFLSNCSVCIALEDIQQRIKFNIKKHVKNKFQWNLLPGMQCEETKWTSYASTAPLSDCSVGKKAAKLPAIKSTISVSEFRIIRRRKQEQSDTSTTQNSENGEIRQPPIKTILFDDINELETPAESQNKRLTLSQNQRGRKRVTFAEKNIYRPIIGYKMRLGETVDKGIMDF